MKAIKAFAKVLALLIAVGIATQALMPLFVERVPGAGRKIMSYWSTKMLVDTDMNNSWVDGEERQCTSVPGGSPRIDMVVCNYDDFDWAPTHFRLKNSHHIPVTFYGDVNRGVQSDWKCRKSSSLGSTSFTCFATN